MLQGVVAPTTLYSSETWLLNAKERRVETFDMNCMRRVLGLNIMGRIRDNVKKNIWFQEKPIKPTESKHPRTVWAHGEDGWWKAYQGNICGGGERGERVGHGRDGLIP